MKGMPEALFESDCRIWMGMYIQSRSVHLDVETYARQILFTQAYAKWQNDGDTHHSGRSLSKTLLRERFNEVDLDEGSIMSTKSGL